MKILQICHKPPLPAIDGGCVAMRNISQGLLNAGHNIKILSLATHKHPFQPEKIPESFKQQTRIEAVKINTKPEPINALTALVKGDSYNVSRFHNKLFEELIVNTIRNNEFDIIQLESLYTTPYLPAIRKHSKVPVLLRSHNVEYKIWEQQAKQCSKQPKKAYLKSLAKALKKYEIEHLNSYNAIATISESDLNDYQADGCKLPMTNIPLGIDTHVYIKVASETAINNTIFHLGAMDWEPNIQAVDWLLKDIWPSVNTNSPDAQLIIAGKNMPKHIYLHNNESVIVKGEVEDAMKFMAENKILVVPLKSGSGMRVKIIEAMAMGKAVIATPLALSGIPTKNKQHCLVAKNTNEFTTHITSILNEPETAQTIGKNAQKLVQDHFDNEKITQKLVDFYREIIAK